MTVFQNVQVALIARNKKHLSFFSLAHNLYKQETEELLELVNLAEETEGIAGELAYGKQKQLELAISSPPIRSYYSLTNQQRECRQAKRLRQSIS